jgi:lauroyl/myristoyl acyltransferase
VASVLREGVFQVVRRAGGALPLPVLAALLYPAAFVRAFFETLARRGPRPPMSLPPDELGAGFGVVLRERTSAWMNTAALLWADRFDRSPWRQRFELSDLEQLRTLIATRPVLVTTVHFGGIFVMPTLLRALGIPTAAVVGDKLWPVRWWRERRAQLTAVAGLPAHLRSGDARQIARYLRPGRALLVALDYPLGDQVLAGYDGRALRLSTPSIRLARITGAVVVPAILRVDGLWRYSLHVGRPVPDGLLSSADDSAVVAHLVNELLPVAAARPEQALPLLVNSFVDVPR